MVYKGSQLRTAVEAVVSTRKGGVAHLRNRLLCKSSLAALDRKGKLKIRIAIIDNPDCLSSWKRGRTRAAPLVGRGQLPAAAGAATAGVALCLAADWCVAGSLRRESSPGTGPNAGGETRRFEAA